MTIQYDGGYFFLNENIVRGNAISGHTARDLSGLSETTVEAVNLIQETPWKINRFILDVVNAFQKWGNDVVTYDEDGKDADTILRLAVPVNPRLSNPDGLFSDFDPEDWAAKSKEEKRKFRTKRARTLKKYDHQLGVYRATKRLIGLDEDGSKLGIANEMAQFDKFYFPHNMDFRLRIYPIPTDLNPQANDLSKALLQFARPTPLGKEGSYWLSFTVASLWGEDKLFPDERVTFADEQEFFQMCCRCVDDPLKHREWLKADKPFQFLAVAYEHVWSRRSGNREQYLSYIPGNLDGSCNGAQHLSILSRDMVGATATNCRETRLTNGRHDLYMTVADAVWEVIQVHASDPSSEFHNVSLEWVSKMSDPSKRRKVVKRAVMTVPYGVTEHGVADFMINDNHVSEDADNQWDSAKYMRDLIWEAVEGTMQRGRELQRYFSLCASICSAAGKPLVWDTPVGSKVTQAYRNTIARRIKCHDTRFIVYAEPEEDEDDETFLERIGLNDKKMATSAPPNVVHSCDAAHLQATTVMMGQAGIKDFSMIHDSFGCPMAHVGTMRDILRNVIVDMYKDNYILQWKESVEKYSGLTMPEPPELGEFDITEILQSEFFFS